MKNIYKVWIANDEEHFIFGNEGSSRVSFPFGTSLLSMLYLDIGLYKDLFDGMGVSLHNLYRSREEQYIVDILDSLDIISKEHIYFELLRINWRERFIQAKEQGYSSNNESLAYKKLTHIPFNIHNMQSQIKALFKEVLDIDFKPKIPVQKKMINYYNSNGHDTLHTFRFESQSINFELIDDNTFAEVLYPNTIYDIIDFFLREFIKREQPVRICKNCSRYFAIIGRNNKEYCERIFDDKGRTCKQVGAINQWLEKRNNDDVFKLYRREYKKRFAWIKSGKIEREDFYIWSEKARNYKIKCDCGEISLQEFFNWLNNS